MKTRLLQTVSLLLAIHFLFITLDVNVNIHYCSEDHHVSTSFGDASRLCRHCLGHHHHDHPVAETFFSETDAPLHFAPKCCCEDYDNEIHLTELASPDFNKPFHHILPCAFLPSCLPKNLNVTSVKILPECLQPHRVFFLLTGRLKTIFFSQLKLNPAVF